MLEYKYLSNIRIRHWVYWKFSSQYLSYEENKFSILVSTGNLEESSTKAIQEQLDVQQASIPTSQETGGREGRWGKASTKTPPWRYLKHWVEIASPQEMKGQKGIYSKWHFPAHWIIFTTQSSPWHVMQSLGLLLQFRGCRLTDCLGTRPKQLHPGRDYTNS